MALLVVLIYPTPLFVWGPDYWLFDWLLMTEEGVADELVLFPWIRGAMMLIIVTSLFFI